MWINPKKRANVNSTFNVIPFNCAHAIKIFFRMGYKMNNGIAIVIVGCTFNGIYV
jgi:hypothetical protein